MSKLVTIFGGSGFVGRYVARRMARAGWRVRVAVRRPNEALFVRTYGAVGQVEPVLCNVRDRDSVRLALQGAEAAVNCVGILAESGRNTFGLVQHYGALHIAEEARAAGVARLVQISAIGADIESDSAYSETKGRGEAAVRESFPDAVILRPSLIFGPEDQFFNRFAQMARFSPVLPVVGCYTRFQPVYVDDVAAAAATAAMGEAAPGIYELGGPEVRSFGELMEEMLEVIGRPNRIVLPLPLALGAAMGTVFDLVQSLSLGLLDNKVVTRDQVRNLGRDNVVGDGMPGLAELGIQPTAMEAVLPEYLWRYRPAGQFYDVREAAKRLKS
ncbi:complex I NDUFA9 subunit family protein [Rhodovulum sulfidophilum]|uniref:complex I NDUFA9 subunit family protein n=1 Tax=Rhodovulum visakhapatnamense TaxID=364297 RepID=UPI00095303F3|nr:complex I NDUFA9 subunit family protein [Rhodovulum visakhapatnamense]MBL3570117.1 complex I NDUFA9 subunit family protein [Rhodovulum visakhapatnamense]OLS43008.1 complex I NDUFA9 subunit family protein [Rhodovulum sulfidophilum]